MYKAFSFNDPAFYQKPPAPLPTGLGDVLIYHRNGSNMLVRRFSGDLEIGPIVVWTNSANLPNRDMDYHKENDEIVLSYKSSISNARALVIDASTGTVLHTLAYQYPEAVCWTPNGDIITGGAATSTQVRRLQKNGTIVWSRDGGNQTRQTRYIEEDSTIAYTGFSGTGRYTDTGTSIWRITGNDGTDTGTFRLSPSGTVIIRDNTGTSTANKVRNYTNGSLITSAADSVRQFSSGVVLSNGDYVYWHGVGSFLRRVNPTHTTTIWQTVVIASPVSPAVNNRSGMDVDENDNIYVSYRNNGIWYLAMFSPDGVKINEKQLFNTASTTSINIACTKRRGICRT